MSLEVSLCFAINSHLFIQNFLYLFDSRFNFLSTNSHSVFRNLSIQISNKYHNDIVSCVCTQHYIMQTSSGQNVMKNLKHFPIPRTFCEKEKWKIEWRWKMEATSHLNSTLNNPPIINIWIFSGSNLNNDDANSP